MLPRRDQLVRVARERSRLGRGGCRGVRWVFICSEGFYLSVVGESGKLG